MTTPPRKKLVPLSLCLWKKKENVLLRPMMRERPVRNSSCGEGEDREHKQPPPTPGPGPGPGPGLEWPSGVGQGSPTLTGMTMSDQVTQPCGKVTEPWVISAG